MVAPLWLLLLMAVLPVWGGESCSEPDPFLPVRVGAGADVLLGVVMPLHESGRGVFGCGRPSRQGTFHFEALRWAVRALNRDSGEVDGTSFNESFIPGVKMGLEVYDSCGHTDLSVRHVTELFPVLKSGSEECATSVIGLIDMSSTLDDPRVSEAAGRHTIPVIPLRRDAMVAPRQLAQALVGAARDMLWERVALVHAVDEYSLSVAKAFGQVAKGPCIVAVRALPAPDRKTFRRVVAFLSGRLPVGVGVVVIGPDDASGTLLRALDESPAALSQHRWLFSWLPQTSALSRGLLQSASVFSLAPFPARVPSFEEYWNRLQDDAEPHTAEDRFFLELVMQEKGCLVAGWNRTTLPPGHPVCENFVLKETPLDAVERSASFLPSLHAVFAFAHAFRDAWRTKCKGVAGMCLNLRRMQRREFLEQFLEPLEFELDSRDRSPVGVEGGKGPLTASGEVEGARVALNAYTWSPDKGPNYKQLALYDASGSRVLDAASLPVPSLCPKEGCGECVSVRQSRQEEPPLLAEPSLSNGTDDLPLPLLLPLHRAGSSPLECGQDLDPAAVQDLEAALWTADQINRDSEFLPGVRLRIVPIDTCSSPVRVTRALAEHLLGPSDEPLHPVALVAAGASDEIAAAATLGEALNLTTVSVGDSILKGRHQLQVSVPAERKVRATLAVLRSLGWSFVSAVRDEAGRAALDAFRAAAREAGGEPCVAEELALEDDGDADAVVRRSVRLARERGARAVVMWTGERSTRAFLRGVHRAVLAGQVGRGDLVVISSGDWIVNLQSFEEFENEATGVLVLKTQQGEVSDFAAHYRKTRPLRNPWFESACGGGGSCEYAPSPRTADVIQAVLAVSAGLARLRNERCHPEPGLCPALLGAPRLREALHRSIRETASSRLDAKGDMFAFTRRGRGNLPVEIFNFRRAAGKNFVYEKVGTFDTHLTNLAEIVVYNSENREVPADHLTSDCTERCDECRRRPTDFVILDSKDHLYLAAAVDVHSASPTPLACGANVRPAGLLDLEAFLWALDRLNGSPHVLPGVNIGAVIFDTCGSREKAARDVANFFSSSLSGGGQKLPAPQQIAALVAAERDVDPVVDVAMPFGVMTLAPRVTATRFNDVARYPFLLRLSLPDDVRAAALADLLAHFGWNYVSVLHAESWKEGDGGLSGAFRRRAGERDIEFAVEERVGSPLPDGAARVLLDKLEEKRKEGARVVVLFLEPEATSELLAVAAEGRFTWVTANAAADAFHERPLASVGALALRPSEPPFLPFRRHFGSLRPGNNSRNPWFRDFWEQVFHCRGCEGESLQDLPLLKESRVSRLVDSVLSAGAGLEALRRRLCPGTDRGLCPAMKSHPQMREILFNLTAEGGEPVRFTARRYSASTLNLLHFGQVGLNAHAFVHVGAYSPDEGLSVNFSRIRSYDKSGKEVSLYDVRSSRSGRATEVAAMQAVARRGFSLLVAMPVHGRGSGFFECGALREFDHLVGIAFAARRLDLGALVFDSCDRAQRGENQVYGFFTNGGSSRIRPDSAVAAITFGADLSRETAPIFESLGVTQIASPVDARDADAFDDILRTAPSALSQIQALLSLLKEFRWMYVNIVYSNTDFGRAGYYRFAKGAEETGVCLAHVVVVERDSRTDSILTNLQNGLNREAGVVVSLVDDERLARAVAGAVGRSEALAAFVWVGTETWGEAVADEPLPRLPFDAVALKPESQEMPDLDTFYESLTLWNHYPIPDPWFEEFWQHHFRCRIRGSRAQQSRYTDECSGDERLAAGERRPAAVYQTVRTVEAVADGLDRYLRGGACALGASASDLRDCGRDARQGLRREVRAALRGAYPECEECTSSRTLFGFDIVRHSGNATRRQIGSWKDGILSVDVAPFSRILSAQTCADGDCTCGSAARGESALSREEEGPFSGFRSVWGATVSALSLVGVLLVAGCALYFLVSFPVAVGTTVLGYLMLFGLLLLFAVNFAFVLDPSEWTCGVRRFGPGLAYAVVFAGALVKVLNTWRLMGCNGSRMLSDGTRLSSPSGLLVVALGLVLVQVVLSSAWLVLMPPALELHRGLPRCAPAAAFEAGLALSLSYSALLLAAAALFAGLTWSCRDNNLESRWILVCSLATAGVWAGTAVAAARASAPRQRDAALAVANLTSASLIMAFLYLRKVYLYGKLTRQARDRDLKARLQPYAHSIYGSSQKTFSTLAPAIYGSQASVCARAKPSPSSRVELIHCPEDDRSDSGSSAQVQAADLYPLDVYDGGSQFQAVASLYGSNHTLVLDDTLPLGR